MCSNSVAAGALGGIQGTLDLLARNQSRQNNMTGALARQVQIANQWQVTAFKLQNERAEWKALSRKTLEALEKEEQVSADLRQQLEQSQNRLAQAQEALQAEKKLRDDEFNERVEKYNRLVRKTNRLIDCLTAVKAQPGSAVALIAALEAELKAQQA